MKKAFLTDKDALVRGIPEEVDAVFYMAADILTRMDFKDSSEKAK